MLRLVPPHVMPRGAAGGRHIGWIDIAKSAIAGDDIRHAGVEGLILAIPIHFAGADIHHRAPRRVAVTGMARRHSEAQERRRAGDCPYDPFHGVHLGLPPRPWLLYNP